MKVKIIDKFAYQSFPCTEDMVDIDDKDIEQIGVTKCFDVENKKVVDYVCEDEQTSQRYGLKVNTLIREKYTLSQELAIMRQHTDKPDEYTEYYAYCEQCKITAKAEIYKEQY